MKRALPKLSLVQQFGLLSLAAFALLGLALAYTLRAQVRAEATASAAQAAELVARLGIQPHLRPDDLRNGLTRARVAELDRLLEGGRLGEQVVRLKIWSRDSRVVYSDDPRLIGRSYPPSDDLREALEGEVAAEISGLDEAEDSTERGRGPLLEVYVPLRFGSATSPAGAFEVYIPYTPVAEAISRDTTRLSLILVAGLALLWAALFRLVAAASRHLQQQAEENRHQALHDTLTGLPNRTLFHDRVHQALLTARRDGLRLAVMIMDVDRFKEINETLGHQNGDRLLRLIALRLKGSLRESDTIARLGGDEFGLLLQRVEQPGAAAQVARKVIKALKDQPLVVGGLTLDIGASLGIAQFPEHGEDVDALLQRADVAMYAAKESLAGYETYREDHNRYSPSRLALAGELRRAIEERALILHYQPKAELGSGRIRGVEALVRWHHPTRGLLTAEEFVPLAESTGLIKGLTLLVLEAGLRQLRTWRRSGMEITVAVNISAANLHDPRFPREVKQLLRRWKVDPSWLELEITESSIMKDSARALEVLAELSAMGVRLSIDDFGTGYSSLAYLQQLPVQEIKIDKSFVLGLVADPSAAMIVRSVIDLGRNLGLSVVAEGVETEAIWRQLNDLGADLAQGFYLGKPAPSDETGRLLAGIKVPVSGVRRPKRSQKSAART
ncbi:MAG: putative bifunctional diguanylate cyclase/phosphodiesterase [Actinomycetota bacterium]